MELRTVEFPRRLFLPEHDGFRRSFRRFVDREIVPHAAVWERQGRVDRAMLAAAGAEGFLGMAIPARYGGAEQADFRYMLVEIEELADAGVFGCGVAIERHNLVTSTYLNDLTTPGQRERWLGDLTAGRRLATLATSEHFDGADLLPLSVRAVPDGDAFVLNGRAEYVGNGLNADLILVAARTNPYAPLRNAISLFLVEADSDGVLRERAVRDAGPHAQDVARLVLDNARVPAENLLGQEGHGLRYLTANQSPERLSAAVSALSVARTAFRWTLEYARRNRSEKAGSPSTANQLRLAELRTALDVAQAFVDRCVELHDSRSLSAENAAKAKWWTGELLDRTVDECVRLHGDNGHSADFPVARASVDARITKTWVGSTEAMKFLVASSLE